MTVGASVALANAFLNHLTGNGTWTAPAGLYLQVHVGDPGAAGAANLAAGSTTRAQLTTGAASAGSASKSNAVTWTNGGATEILSHISVWSAPTGGTFLFSMQLATAQGWSSGQTVPLDVSTLSLLPIAQ